MLERNDWKARLVDEFAQQRWNKNHVKKVIVLIFISHKQRQRQQRTKNDQANWRKLNWLNMNRFRLSAHQINLLLRFQLLRCCGFFFPSIRIRLFDSKQFVVFYIYSRCEWVVNVFASVCVCVWVFVRPIDDFYRNWKKK